MMGSFRERVTIRLLGALPGALGLFLRQRFYTGLFARCGRRVVFGRSIFLGDPGKVTLGEGAVLSDRCRILAANGGIELGEGTFIGTGTVLETAGGELKIDRGANLGAYCEVRSEGSVRIGRHVLLAAFCRVGGEEDGEPGGTGSSSPEEVPVTEIGDGSWLGVRVTVSPGVRVGQGSIVGAHAEVTEDLPPWSIAVGRPARVLRSRKDPS